MPSFLSQVKSKLANPILVNVLRRGVVESTHRGSVVVVNNQGEVVFAIGDPQRMIYPRSSLKFLQAIPLLESGAADQYALTAREIALACASHNAESIHTEAVKAWLGRLQLGVDDLECGPTLPLGEDAAHELIARGETPTRAHQNCSGKHSGMLTMARFLGVPTKGYSEYDHPAQQAWITAIGELVDMNVAEMHWERDGCGMPAVMMPIHKLAYGFARFNRPQDIGGRRGEALQRIASAVAEYPEMIAGSKRCCTAVIRETGGKVLVKTGAEGVYGGCVPHLGLGFALKADDGATRGSEVMLGALLDKLGALEPLQTDALKDYFKPQIVNSQQRVTGQLLPSTDWDDA